MHRNFLNFVQFNCDICLYAWCSLMKPFEIRQFSWKYSHCESRSVKATMLVVYSVSILCLVARKWNGSLSFKRVTVYSKKKWVQTLVIKKVGRKNDIRKAENERNRIQRLQRLPITSELLLKFHFILRRLLVTRNFPINNYVHYIYGGRR